MSTETKKCKNKSQLANEYNVSRNTFANWLKRFPEEISKPLNGNLFTPLQVSEIYKKLDAPGFEKDEPQTAGR
jgi:transposase